MKFSPHYTLVFLASLALGACQITGGDSGESPRLGSTMVSQLALDSCPEASGCPNGCIQIDYGVDEDASGILETDEIDGTEFVCHGTHGQDGTSGSDGSTGAQGPSGRAGQDGQDGADGTDGANGDQGPAGQDGQDGANGANGADGADGTDGEDGSDCTVTTTGCEATISCEDGTSVSWQLAGCSCDSCNVCDFDTANDCTQDCWGEWGGDAVLDQCNTCDSDLSNDCVQDCTGTWGGTATLDNCSTCVGGSTGLSACTEDCTGTWGGTATPDNCNTCVGGSTGLDPCTQDCHGSWGGLALQDHCGICDEDPSNDNTTCEQDCAGVWGGVAHLDNCGTCDDNPGNDCTLDCNGVWGGSAAADLCGVCGGGCSMPFNMGSFGSTPQSYEFAYAMETFYQGLSSIAGGHCSSNSRCIVTKIFNGVWNEHLYSCSYAGVDSSLITWMRDNSLLWQFTAYVSHCPNLPALNVDSLSGVNYSGPSSWPFKGTTTMMLDGIRHLVGQGYESHFSDEQKTVINALAASLSQVSVF